MELPEDLKNLGADNDAFQLFSEETAGKLFGLLAAALFLSDSLDRLGVTHFWR